MRRWRVCILATLLCGSVALAGGFRKSPADEAQEARRDSLRQAQVVVEKADPSAPSPGGLFLRSMVLPGWGQAVLARTRPEVKGRGRAGFWLDMGLAAGVWGLSRYSEIKAAEYRSYAMRVAGAASHGADSDYWVDVSNYLSREDFNQAMLEANLSERRYLEEADDWNWGEREHRIRYRDLRAMSERAQAQALATCGALFVNHMLSGVQVLRLARTPRGLELGASPTAPFGSMAGIALVARMDLAHLLR